MDVTLLISSAGGIVSFLGAVIVIARGIFRQADATKDNTTQLVTLNQRLDSVANLVNGLNTRMSVLEDRTRR